MSEMEKRVAAAMQAAYPGRGYPDFTILARAAIKAMREPTDAMMNAAPTAPGDYCDPTPAWQAMIDAALKEDAD